jgi:hypothetical protein
MKETEVLYPVLLVSHFVAMMQLADALLVLEEAYSVVVALIDVTTEADILPPSLLPSTTRRLLQAMAMSHLPYKLSRIQDPPIQHCLRQRHGVPPRVHCPREVLQPAPPRLHQPMAPGRAASRPWSTGRGLVGTGSIEAGIDPFCVARQEALDPPLHLLVLYPMNSLQPRCILAVSFDLLRRPAKIQGTRRCLNRFPWRPTPAGFLSHGRNARDPRHAVRYTSS